MKLSMTKWINWLKRKLTIHDPISIDIETTGLDIYKDVIHFLTYRYRGKEGLIILRPDLTKKPALPSWLVKVLEDPAIPVIIHSSQFDAPMLRLHLGVHIRNIWDTAITEQVLLAGVYDVDPYSDSRLDNTLARYKIAKISKDVRESFVGYFGPITEKQKKYGLRDIRFLEKLARRQLERARELKLEQTVKLENLTCEVTAELRYQGIGFDEQLWMDMAEENEIEYKRRLKTLPKEVTNWNSHVQIKKYFKEHHDITIESLTDLPNVKNKTLDKFKLARELYKANSGYGFGFLVRGGKKKSDIKRPTVDDDCRIRPNYNQIMETGRYSTSKPNLQNIPASPSAGGIHRNAFIPSRGCRFVVGDFTGQELGIMAAGSGEKWWIKTLSKGDDLHSVLATKLFPDWNDVAEKGCIFPKKCSCPEHKKKRRPAKDLNFGIAYGKGWKTFGIEAGLQPNVARKLFKKYKIVNPRLNAWLESKGREAIRTGQIRTLEPFNRLRKVIGEDWKKRNRGKNTPVQGSGADMMKFAMCMIYCYIYDNKLQDKVKMVLTVHDELLTDCLKSFCKPWMKVMKYYMEEAAKVITIKKLVTTTPEIMDKWELKD